MPITSLYMWAFSWQRITQSCKSLTLELYSHQAGQISEIAFLYWDTNNDDANNDTPLLTSSLILITDPKCLIRTSSGYFLHRQPDKKTNIGTFYQSNTTLYSHWAVESGRFYLNYIQLVSENTRLSLIFLHCFSIICKCFVIPLFLKNQIVCLLSSRDLIFKKKKREVIQSLMFHVIILTVFALLIIIRDIREN